MDASSKARGSLVVAVAVLLFCVSTEVYSLVPKTAALPLGYRAFDCLWIAAQVFIGYEIINGKRWASSAYLLMVGLELVMLFSVGLHSVFSMVEFVVLLIGGWAVFNLLQAPSASTPCRNWPRLLR